MATRQKNNLVVVSETTTKKFSTNQFVRLLLIVVLLGTLLFLGAKRYRHLFVVGMVNTTPITRWQLDSLVFERYGKSTLDEIVNTVLLEQLAKKNDVAVTSSDIQGEITSLEDRLGGKEALKANMDRFGIDESKLQEEVKAILIQKKLAQKLFQVTISDEDIQLYYDENKTLFADQKLADVKDEIKKTLEDQRLQQEFTTWFQDQRQQAKVNLFI